MRARVLWLLVLCTACGRFGYDDDPGDEPIVVPPEEGGSVVVPAVSLIPSCGGFVDGPANYRSIGSATDLVSLASASGAEGSDVLSFEADLPETVGCGDEIRFAAGSAFVLGRLSERDIQLQGVLAKDVDSASVSIHRAYSELDFWESDRQGDLVAENRIEVGVIYNDGVFDLAGRNRGARISGSTTDPTHYLRLAVSDGHGHGGLADSGVLLEGGGSTPYGIVISDDHTQLVGIAMSGFYDPAEFGSTAINVLASNVSISQVLIRDFASLSAAGIRTSNQIEDASVDIRNSVIYDGYRGIFIQGKLAVADIKNVTVFAMQGPGVHLYEGTTSLVNAISMDSDMDDFRVDGTVLGQSNLSSDGTAPGDSPIVGESSANVFVSSDRDAIDLHIKDGSPAMGAGSGMPTTELDIDLQLRPLGGGWDIGADER